MQFDLSKVVDSRGVLEKERKKERKKRLQMITVDAASHSRPLRNAKINGLRWWILNIPNRKVRSNYNWIKNPRQNNHFKSLLPNDSRCSSRWSMVMAKRTMVNGDGGSSS